MNTKLFSFVSVVVLTVAASVASAAPVQLTATQLDRVTAGGTRSVAMGGNSYANQTVSSSAYNISFAINGAVVSYAASSACSGRGC